MIVNITIPPSFPLHGNDGPAALWTVRLLSATYYYYRGVGFDLRFLLSSGELDLITGCNTLTTVERQAEGGAIGRNYRRLWLPLRAR